MSNGKDVHTEHCCIRHGCKYGKDNECSVCTREKKQSFPCESCRLEDDDFKHLVSIGLPTKCFGKRKQDPEEKFKLIKIGARIVYLDDVAEGVIVNIIDGIVFISWVSEHFIRNATCGEELLSWSLTPVLISVLLTDKFEIRPEVSIGTMSSNVLSAKILRKSECS